MERRVALLDAGAQLEKVIMRRVVELGYRVDKFPVDVSPDELRDYDAIIISGGPRSVNDEGAMLPDNGIYNLGKPILGICYGLQAISQQLGGSVEKGVRGQYGRSHMEVCEENALFSGLESVERVLMSHFDTVNKVPEGFRVYGRSEGMVAAMGDSDKKIYAVQFHPELIPVTRNGRRIFENFLQGICNFPRLGKRNIEEEIEHAKGIIQGEVGNDKYVMHYLSGGVDSTVMAILLAQTIEPDRLFIRTLDTGTMRLGEISEVKSIAEYLGLPNFEVLDVRGRFYNSSHEVMVKGMSEVKGPLYQEIDPEVKRKLFGTEYAEVALEEMDKICRERGISRDSILLGQGTLRPDLIESGDQRVTKGKADTIKTHHNAVDALKEIPKVEPLVDMFKDQVREIALTLGLGEEFAYRQPFPGPGLYCRIIGTRGFREDESFLGLEKRVSSEAEKRGFNAHVLPVRTVGVQGDERSYKYPVVVSGEINWNDFSQLVLDLPNEITEINRVLYTPESVSQDEAFDLTLTSMTEDVIMQSQEADLVMREIAEDYGFNDSRRCSQMPGILIPNSFGRSGNRSFVIRPVWTHDFMALIGMSPMAEYEEERFPEEMFYEMDREIPNRVMGLSRVLLDISDKPPASTEWE